MQLKVKTATVKFLTKEGELTVTRSEYEALKEVFDYRGIKIPNWNEMAGWPEAQFEVRPSNTSRSYQN